MIVYGIVPVSALSPPAGASAETSKAIHAKPRALPAPLFHALSPACKDTLGDSADGETERAGEEAFVECWSCVASGVGVDFAVGETNSRAEVTRDAAPPFPGRVQKLEEPKGLVQDAGAGSKGRRELERSGKAGLEAVVERMPVARTLGRGSWHGGDGRAAYTESTEEQEEGMRQQQ